MVATYTPVETPKDEVRLEVGDTDMDYPMLQDEEIAHYLAIESGSVLSAAARAAAAIAGKFARLTSTTEGDVRTEAQQMFEHYRDMAKEIAGRSGVDVGVAAPYAGGLTVGDVRGRAINPDLVDPFFTRRTGDNPVWRLGRREEWP